MGVPARSLPRPLTPREQELRELELLMAEPPRPRDRSPSPPEGRQHMPALSEKDMAVWEITYRDPGRPSCKVRACYVTGTDKTMPGQLVLKDWRHRQVGSVPADQQLAVLRADHVCACG